MGRGNIGAGDIGWSDIGGDILRHRRGTARLAGHGEDSVEGRSWSGRLY